MDTHCVPGLYPLAFAPTNPCKFFAHVRRGQNAGYRGKLCLAHAQFKIHERRSTLAEQARMLLDFLRDIEREVNNTFERERLCLALNDHLQPTSS